MLPIESKMEVFARTYSKDTCVNVRIGSEFCTDGNNIWVVPVLDQTDEWVRLMTEVCVYHETGHIVTKDVPKMPLNTVNKSDQTSVHKTKHSIANAVRDVCIEKYMETTYPGMKPKWVKFLTEYVQKNTNNEMSSHSHTVFKKLMWALYLRAREKQLGIDLGLKMPVELEELFQDKLAQFVDEVASHTTVKQSMDLTDRIFETLNMDEEKQEKEKQQSSGGSDKNKNNDPQPGNSDNNKSESSKSNDKDESDDGDKDESDDGDKDESDDGDKDESDDGDKDKSDDGDKDESDDSDSKSGSDKDESDGMSGSENDDENKPALSDDAKKALKKLKSEMDDGIEDGGIGKDIANDINQYANNTKLYRETPGLRENIVTVPERFNWEQEVERYETQGRIMTGYLGRKMKILFISERAPRWSRNLRSGRLDTFKLTKLIEFGSLNVCKKKTEHIHDDSAVYLLIDNSSSMVAYSNGQTVGISTPPRVSDIAQSIMTSVASDLDKLRIPFEACGFTTSDQNSSLACQGIRDLPITIHRIKDFDEAYRRVRHRFVWPSYNMLTAELPAIRHAVNRLIQRRETKKVLFLLSDGQTSTINSILTNAMHKATIEYVDRIKRAGIKVVLIGIQDNHIKDYSSDAIIVNDLKLFASQFYRKLTEILL